MFDLVSLLFNSCIYLVIFREFINVYNISKHVLKVNLLVIMLKIKVKSLIRPVVKFNVVRMLPVLTKGF
jgi:hypothetical protein